MASSAAGALSAKAYATGPGAARVGAVVCVLLRSAKGTPSQAACEQPLQLVPGGGSGSSAIQRSAA